MASTLKMLTPSANEVHATPLPGMSQAVEIISEVPPNWSKTWDGQP